MANFNLPFGVRVSNNNPLDAERYVVADITARDALLGTPIRAYEGLQVYVESEKNLYILKDVDLSTWELVGGGASYLSSLLDVSIGSDVSSGFVLVYDPSANDVSKWYAVQPINAADFFIPEASFNDAYFKWSGGLLEPSIQSGAPDASIEFLYNWDFAKDASIVSLRAVNVIQDSSIVTLQTLVNNASTFLGLYDTPSSYQAGKLVAANDACTGLEFVPRIWRESNNEITVDDPCSNVLFYDYIELEADAGVATLIDKEITVSSGSTEQSYNFNLDGSAQLKVYGVANGAGALDGSQGVAVMNYFYIGDPALPAASNTCFRMFIDVSSLVVQKRNSSGTWIESGRFN